MMLPPFDLHLTVSNRIVCVVVVKDLFVFLPYQLSKTLFSYYHTSS